MGGAGGVSTVKLRVAAALVPAFVGGGDGERVVPWVSAGEVKEPRLHAVAATVVGPAFEQLSPVAPAEVTVNAGVVSVMVPGGPLLIVGDRRWRCRVDREAAGGGGARSTFRRWR